MVTLHGLSDHLVKESIRNSCKEKIFQKCSDLLGSLNFNIKIKQLEISPLTSYLNVLKFFCFINLPPVKNNGYNGQSFQSRD